MRVRDGAAERRSAAFVRRGLVALLVPMLIAGGCASDDGPPGDTPATAAALADLDSCRSAATAAGAANIAEGFLTGALVGAAHGAAAGAHRGGADVGAIVGASVGALAGFFQGLRWSRGASVTACMQSKGYRRI
jgi:F0F1-type ATP synthase assembly protein I